ncbi:MAG: Ppx/GppA family phosphatase [Solirubrobacterales bacterium]|nr:Ppx/GppA family phosphatase [Solirubrobacterales bacterium]
MKIAIIDVGTNTTRLLIAEVEGGHIVREQTRLSRITRLGAGLDASGRLDEDALARVHAALSEYTTTVRGLADIQQVEVLMTSAVRDAKNGRQFADDVLFRYGVRVHVISGEEEAQLTYRGATDELEPDDQARTLVLDIGGGSTELIVGNGQLASFNVSTQIGVVRHSDRHIKSDPPAAEELDAMAKDVRATLAEAVPEPERGNVVRALAVAGTPTSLAAIDQELDPYDPAKVHGYKLTRQAVARLYAQLRDKPLAELKQLKGLHPDRAGVIVPGALILAEVMELFSLGAVQVSEHDILRGAAVSLANEPAAQKQGARRGWRRLFSKQRT